MLLSTPNFLDQASAVKYYYPQCRSQDEAVTAIAQMLAGGQIFLGPPTTGPFDTVVLTDLGTRYSIQQGAFSPVQVLAMEEEKRREKDTDIIVMQVTVDDPPVAESIVPPQSPALEDKPLKKPKKKSNKKWHKKAHKKKQAKKYKKPKKRI
jgi:hypothetical protein